ETREKRMEGILAGCSPRVRVMFPVASSVNPARNLTSKELVPGVLVPGARRSAPLRCTRSEQVRWFLEIFSPSGRLPSRRIRQNTMRYRCIIKNICILNCFLQKSTDERVTLTYNGDDFVNSVEVQEWESGMSLNDIAAKQGIRIRRSHRTGHPSEGSKDEKETPRNILEQIIWDKEVEVAQVLPSFFKQTKPLETLKKAVEGAPPVRDFVGALRESYRRTGVPALIAEVKKASPSKGVLREDFDPVSSATLLSALSPMITNAVLLIAGVLPDLDIKYMTRICRELGLTALIEVHDEREMDRVLKIDGIQLIGINNRNLGMTP
ncbi:hypothetical protein BHM03_00037347, partial [Ensete ventricosum]